MGLVPTRPRFKACACARPRSLLFDPIWGIWNECEKEDKCHKLNRRARPAESSITGVKPESLESEGINVSTCTLGQFEAENVDAATIFRIAVDAGVTLTSLQKVSPSLEDVYTSLTA